ncbi:hypothetical protein E2C01_051821 [Portunus trituberculatus]|uniref:Uncharacterized protein n=1 Tax=Portunus trituberculatus TaxID=210409 RepID=A0A5B7GK37_PORTR|nr:hypothetical protein [Portunus trituberculatus]
MDDIRLCFLADAQTCLPSLPTLSSSPSSFSFPVLLFPCCPHVPVTPNVTFHTLLVHCCIISSLTPWLLRPSLPLKRSEISTLVPPDTKLHLLTSSLCSSYKFRLAAVVHPKYKRQQPYPLLPVHYRGQYYQCEGVSPSSVHLANAAGNEAQ